MDRPLIDAAGTEHAPAGEAARIVSLVPSLTELLIDLGLGAQLVGRTHYCIHPADRVAAIPSLGGTKKINMERLAALAPSHAIVNIDENTEAMAAAIGEIVPHIVVTHPLAPGDNPALFRLLGGIFGRAERAEEFCAAFAEALTHLRQVAGGGPARRVLYLIWMDPWMTVSRDTYVSRLLALVNWHTQGHDPEIRYPELEITGELLAGTDLVLFPSEPYEFTGTHMEAFRAAHGSACPELRLIDGEYCSWYGTRAIRALDYLARFAATPG
jgi:ABC-type Fe3+-hydroxamate transport system substrate-binding protein